MAKRPVAGEVFRDGDSMMKVALLVGVGVGIVAIASAASGSPLDGRSLSFRTWPIVPNRGILSAFGTPRPATAGAPSGRQHAGVDVAALEGDRVVALDDGVVLHLAAGYEIGAGLQAVAVRHPDADYIYAEIDVSVVPGQQVKAGDVIGAVRHNSSGPGHQMLHLEAWQTGLAPKKFTAWPKGEPRPTGLLNAEELIAPMGAGRL